MARRSTAFLFSFLALGCVASKPAVSQNVPAVSVWATENPDWVEPTDPFRVIGNVYYVGTAGLSSFLIATPDGHFLIDGGLPENAAQIVANIEALGFDIRGVKYLLNSHAHFDHSGGLAELKRLSGAVMISSEADKWALETGLVPGSEEKADYAAPPVMVDQTIGDGGKLLLADTELTAHLTPGHTKGCTSWTMIARDEHDTPFQVLFFCSATVAANRLSPEQYPGIVADYRATFAKARDWRPDVFLANHPIFFEMAARRSRQREGDGRAFIDPSAFPPLIAAMEAAFEKEFARQQDEVE